MHGNYEYDIHWDELNSHLREIEVKNGNLDKALLELEVHQKQAGFLRIGVENVIRQSFHHPDDPTKYLRLQYNPERALRFNGAQETTPPEGTEIKNHGCFLCRDNIRWQQRGEEMGYEIHLGSHDYYAWMNPFPLLPTHVVIASTEHTSQEWPVCEKGRLDVSGILTDLIELACRMPGYIGFYNGVNAGASIPGHLHFQFCKRPVDVPEFPLECAARHHFPNGSDSLFLENYPLHVALWKGDPQTIQEETSRWIGDWAKKNLFRLKDLTANFIVSANDAGDEVTFFFIPRDRTKTHGNGLSGLVGGLEVLGELVFSSAEDKALIDAGDLDYFSLEKILSGVHTPFFPE